MSKFNVARYDTAIHHPSYTKNRLVFAQRCIAISEAHFGGCPKNKKKKKKMRGVLRYVAEGFNASLVWRPRHVTKNAVIGEQFRCCLCNTSQERQYWTHHLIILLSTFIAVFFFTLFLSFSLSHTHIYTCACVFSHSQTHAHMFNTLYHARSLTYTTC